MRIALASFLSVLLLSLSGIAQASTITIDFTEDNFGNVLVDGQDISTPPEFGKFVKIIGAGPNLGSAIFDSTIGESNDGGIDDDLVVGLGNILILQSTDSPTQSVAGVFDTPNDEADGGTIEFTFLNHAKPFSLNLVDINKRGRDHRHSLTDMPVGTFADVIAQLTDGDLRIGLHVRGFDWGGSESFVNTPIPEPSSYVLFFAGLGIVGTAIRRRKS